MITGIQEGQEMNCKRLQEMSDRELRSYKREIRRRREQRKKYLITSLAALATCCIALLGAISYNAIHTDAASGFKYYTGIIVENGDTLWELADQYMDYNHYKDKQAYISEVKSMNHLDGNEELYTGQFLVVPYYSAEYF